MTFENSMKKLEDIVGKIEKSELPLEESLKAFEEGMALVKVCEKQLQELSLRVEKVLVRAGAEAETDEKGRVQTDLFNVDN
ncbi:MAG: exodeoxyribonuclease VII small subunit [Alphaproteobacteria bacterium CG_4_10_14_0_8_um_filter_53_9]|nr:MAG: exodeoxyribonuclease VII small subunit [Alphaproteobacteria bacterium CG_4_10_14_0_8_um_filter_53_9]